MRLETFVSVFLNVLPILRLESNARGARPRAVLVASAADNVRCTISPGRLVCQKCERRRRPQLCSSLRRDSPQRLQDFVSLRAAVDMIKLNAERRSRAEPIFWSIRMRINEAPN